MELPYIAIDTREKIPFQFNKSKNCAGSVKVALKTGDYSILGLENHVIIERKKSVLELCGNLGKNRERFMAEMERMKEIPHKFLIIEENLSQIYNLKFTKFPVEAILGSLAKLMLQYNLHIIFAGNKKNAQELTRKILLKAYEYWREDNPNVKLCAEWD